MNLAQTQLDYNLTLNLENFGLNPNEWIISTDENEHLIVSSLDDPDFSFSAKLDLRLHLLQLELRSI
jgi:hypothetical protein